MRHHSHDLETIATILVTTALLITVSNWVIIPLIQLIWESISFEVASVTIVAISILVALALSFENRRL